MRKNQYLLMPHVPSRDSSKVDSSNSSNTNSSNETSEQSDLSVDSQSIVNHNFLMESHNNENDENYFEIFKKQMKFGTENNTEVTAQIGTTAHLPCTIHSIGEGVVSPDFNLISSANEANEWPAKKPQACFLPVNESDELTAIISFPHRRSQVSWIRRKDYHLLTVGLTTYSSDERFSATHLKNSEV